MNIEELEARLVAAETKLQKLEDIDNIKRLHRAYSYYVMYMLKDEILDCFADHPETRLNWLEGVWLGKEGVRRYFGVGDDSRPEMPPSFTHQVMPIAGVVDVDGDRGHGRWYAFGGVRIPNEKGEGNGSFVGGMYEIEYIKQDGVWKFLKVDWIINYTVQLPEGAWNTMDKFGEAIEAMQAPQADIPPFANDPRFVTGYIYPYHYAHPVTGKTTSENVRNLKTMAAHKAKKAAGQKPADKKK